MANVKNDRKRNRNSLKLILRYVLVFILFGISMLYLKEDMEQLNNDSSQGENSKKIEEKSSSDNLEKQTEVDAKENLNGELELIMIDVGQADCFLLMQNGETALVDCGTRSTGKQAISYLKNMGITKLDYVFGTHPHEDHMGGMYDILTNFKIGKVVIPLVQDRITSNWYLKLLNELSSGKYTIENPEAGTMYNLGDATIKVIGQLDDAKGNLNNYSTVLKVTYGQMDIIMTGDAEIEVEEQILKSGEDIDAEILKLGHHGSDTSTSDEFLNAVSPDYGLISCKIGNKYKHPSKAIVEKLWVKGVRVFRTDEQGTVKAIITANDVKFDKEPADYKAGEEF